MIYHHFTTLENKTSAKTFPKFPSVLRVIECDLQTLSASCYRALIGGFRSYLSITRKTDGNFRNISAGFCFPKSRINENGGKMTQNDLK